MSELYGGFDAGSTQCYISVIDQQGDCVADTDILTGEQSIIALLQSMDPLTERMRVHMEASELTQWIRGIILKQTKIPEVVVSDPKKLSLITRSPHKSDAEDARKLARYLRMGETYPVHYPNDEKMANLKRVVQYGESIAEEKTRIKNKIKGFLRASGIIIKDSTAYSKKRRPKILKRIGDSALRNSLESLYEILDKTEQVARETKKRLTKMSKRWPIIEFFQEVPGMGIILSCRFVAYIQTPWRFDSKQKLWTYCKLGITHRSSNGELLSSPRLNPNGVGTLKDLSRTVFQNVFRTKTDNAIRRSYYQSLERTGDSTHARLNTQRKVLTILWTMWRKRQRYDDQRA
jgi:transposase